ncbi:MAG: hypothetical protein MJY90_06195 [Bacteroidaceae bacterium]|nr:hypothetical protein [Bacteroidaceae bacterium]
MRQKRRTSVIAVTYGRSAPKERTFDLEEEDVRPRRRGRSTSKEWTFGHKDPLLRT